MGRSTAERRAAPVEVSAVDSVARSAIARHIRQCTKQYREVQEAVRGIYRRLWWFAGVLITGQGALIVWLMDKLADRLGR